VIAYYSSVLDYPVTTVWSLIRDFNSYPDYIDGVTESMIEDDRRGDEVGAIRRFCYRGNWVRQRLVRHSDMERILSYAGIEPLPFPPAMLASGESLPPPVRYEGTIQLHRIVDGDRTFIDWPVALNTGPEGDAAWHALFMEWIPQWTESLRRTLAIRQRNA
jgi:hypothetical protein